MRPITPDIAAQAVLLESDDFLIEEACYCGTCGEPFEQGQQVLSVHAPYADIGTHRAIEDIHLPCYQGEEVLTDFHDVSPALVDALRALGNEHGPLGVAVVAAQLTDTAVLVARLASQETVRR